MLFSTKSEAEIWKKTEESRCLALRGRLAIVKDTATNWCRKTGEPFKVSGYAVVIR